jgi:predicted  nucleic acid-binding Zn-ribbon protein
METYQKLKCVYCGYEMASKAKKAKCYKCGHRKFNRIPEFSVTKPYNKLKGGVNMAKETEAKKPEEEKKPVEAEEADEIDALFD